MRQERDGAVHPAPRRRPAGADRRRRDPFCRDQSVGPDRKRDGGHSRQRNLDDFPGADDVAQSADDSGPPDRRGDRTAPGTIAPRRDGRGGRDAAPRPYSRAGAPRARLSASAFGRHAPARDDRDGGIVQSQAADRGRADYRARRDDPGADPRPDARIAGDARHRDRADHPRHGRRRRECRPGGGDVCRAKGRGGERQGSVRVPGSSLHQRTAGLDTQCRSRGAYPHPPRAA